MTTNTWDVRNQLSQVELPSLTVLTYTYDADDRRTGRDDGGEERLYVHDGRNVLIETDELAVVEAENTFEPIEHGKLISQHDGTESHWHAYDALGSTDRLTDSAEVVSDSEVGPVPPAGTNGEKTSERGVARPLYVAGSRSDKMTHLPRALSGRRGRAEENTPWSSDGSTTTTSTSIS